MNELKGKIKNYLKNNEQFLAFASAIFSFPFSFSNIGKLRNNIIMRGAFIKKSKANLIGNRIKIIVGAGSRLTNCLIHVEGSECKLTIGPYCKLNNLELWMEDDNSQIEIGERTTIEGGHIAATEGENIIIGKDCMFSNNIEIRNGDSHSIVALDTNKRINRAKSVQIGHHVWLGAGVKVLKGCQIGDHSIMATGTIVTGNVDSNSIYAGVPARKVKDDISWCRDRV